MEGKCKARRRAVLCLGAAAYALLYALCSQIDQTGSIRGNTTAARFLAAFPVALAVLAAMFGLVLPRLELGPDAAGRKPFGAVGAFCFLLCCYMPVFLIEFPGSFTYDLQEQALQIAAGDYTTFHPLLHTLLIRLCISFYDVLQSLERCAALYSLIQMALVSVCFAQVCASLSRSVSARAARMAMLFFGLYPSHMFFACNCTKDVLFSAFFALFLTLCVEEVSTGKPLAWRGQAARVVSGVIACLMRNNMIYAMAAWGICLLVRRRRMLRLAAYTLLIIVLSRGVNAGLVAATNAQGGKVVEMLSVPVQQLARARLYAPERFTQQELDVVDTVFSGWLHTQYEPTLSDDVKGGIDDEVLRENLVPFLKAWVTVGAKCPGIYLEAFLNLALPSLYPYGRWHVAAKYLETGTNHGALTEPFGQPPIVQPRRFEALRTWLDEHILSTGANDVPVLRWLLNTGAVYWTLLLFFLYDVYCGRFDRVLLLLLAVLLWGTYLLGPVMQGRYLYPFICTLPLFVLRPKGGGVKTIQREE